MAGRWCYLAARPAAVKKIKKDLNTTKWWDDLILDDEVYDLLESNWPSGCQYVEGMDECEDPIQLARDGERNRSWMSADDLLSVEDTEDGWKVWFDTALWKQMWFHDAFTVYREILRDAMKNLTLRGFASYKLACDPWKIDNAYNRQWDEAVMVFNEDGVAVEVDPVMDFLRLMKPREPFVVAKRGFRFK